MIQNILAALLFVVQNLSNNLFSQKFPHGIPRLCLLNGMALALGTAALAVLFRPALIPWGAMGLAVLFGVLFVVTISMIAVTMSKGPMGMSAMVIDMSAVVTILCGTLIWHETITPLRGIGLLLLLVTVILLALPDQKENTRASRAWLITALITMLLNGSLSVVQKAAFAQFTTLSSTDFTFWSLFYGFLACLIALLAFYAFRRGDAQLNFTQARLMLPYSAGLGFGTAGAYYFQNAALQILPSIVVFPVVIGLNVSILMLCSVLFFHERLRPRKAVAFVIGMAGILLMNF